MPVPCHPYLPHRPAPLLFRMVQGAGPGGGGPGGSSEARGPAALASHGGEEYVVDLSTGLPVSTTHPFTESQAQKLLVASARSQRAPGLGNEAGPHGGGRRGSVQWGSWTPRGR
jgi:hypothetical protein